MPARRLAIPAAPSAPTDQAKRTQFKDDAFFDGLRALRDSLPPNKNDRAEVLIEACIAGGVRAKPSIVSVLAYLGFNPGHVGAVIDRGARSSPSTSPRWRKSPDGLYRLLD